MPWYKCFIAGKNFPGELIDEPEVVGFYTTRFIEAGNTYEAEVKVIALVRNDPKLAIKNQRASFEKAEFNCEEIVEVSAQDVPKIQSGFVWHARDKNADGVEIYPTKDKS